MIIRIETIGHIAYTVHRLYCNLSRLNILIETLKGMNLPKHIPIPYDLGYETISDILKYFSGHNNRKVGMRKILEILKLVINPHVHNKFSEELSQGYISEFNTYLGEDKLEIQRRGNNFKLVELTQARMRDTRTLTDHISMAIEYFKSKYSKVNIFGLPYEYDFNSNIGELFRHQNTNTTQIYKDLDIHENLGLVNGETKAFIYLFRHGYIKDFEVKQHPKNLGFELDYALCYIDESKFLNNNLDNIEKTYYITKKNDDYYYNGKLIELSKKSDYYKIFCALYSLLPKGGEIEYKDLIMEIKSRISKTKMKPDSEMRRLIQNNLTGKGNGFMRYSKLPATMNNQKSIIETIRNFGIRFNNEVG